MVETKRCPQCKTVKPVEEFSPDAHKAGGRSSKCRPCDRDRARAYYAANKARKAAKYQEEREEIAALRAAVRKTAERIYGGACAVCGSTDRLEFDHVNNDGKAHREVEHPSQMFRRIAAAGARLTDRDLQLLCFDHHREKSAADRKS